MCSAPPKANISFIFATLATSLSRVVPPQAPTILRWEPSNFRPAQVFLIDIRGTYRAVFNDTMFDRVTNTSNSMQNWNVAGRIGFEF